MTRLTAWEDGYRKGKVIGLIVGVTGTVVTLGLGLALVGVLN